MSNTEHGRNQPPVLQLNPADPLVVATRELKAGEEVGLGDIKPVETIARGHKMPTQGTACHAANEGHPAPPRRGAGPQPRPGDRHRQKGAYSRPAHPRSYCRVPG